MILDRIDAATASIVTLTARLNTELAGWQETVERLATIPGVGTRLAQVLIAETGGDMSRFATAGHLVSWAGMCPGNNESAGKQYSGHTRQGQQLATRSPRRGRHRRGPQQEQPPHHPIQAPGRPPRPEEAVAHAGPREVAVGHRPAAADQPPAGDHALREDTESAYHPGAGAMIRIGHLAGGG